MKHPLSNFVTRLAGVALPIGLIACSDQLDPASPVLDSAPATGVGVQSAPSSQAVQDALTRLVPNLSHAVHAVALGQSLRELATALAHVNDAVTAVAVEQARAAIDQYASSSKTDEAEVDAIRLAIEGHAAGNDR